MGNKLPMIAVFTLERPNIGQKRLTSMGLRWMINICEKGLVGYGFRQTSHLILSVCLNSSMKADKQDESSH